MPIYFARQRGTDFVKIGWAKRDPAGRIRAWSPGSPYPIEILRIIEGDRLSEAWLHRHFRNTLLPGAKEWFRFSDEMLVIEPPRLIPIGRRAQPVDPLVERYLRRACQKAGSQNKFALQAGVRPQYITMVLNGHRPPGPKILAALGLEKQYGNRQHVAAE